MSRLLSTVDDLVSEVRSQLDETNTDSIDDTRDILPALNRAQDYAMDILSRYYPEPLLQHIPVTLTGGTAEYDIPEDCFEDRIQKVEVTISGTQRPVERISYRDISHYETSATTSTPQWYCVVGRKYRLVPTPNGTYPLRIWYLRNPETLVKSQGRITRVVTASNYVVVDSAGDSLTTEADQLGSYVNIVDGQTGLIKSTHQIQISSNNRITFRTSPTRSEVLGRTVSTSLPSTTNLDDYLAPISGTCVLYFDKPTRNFIIKHATAELTGRLGGDEGVQERILERFEKQMTRNWTGREQQLRVKKKSPSWGMPPIRRTTE